MPIELPRISARNLPTVVDAIVLFPDDQESGLSVLLETTIDEAQNLFAAARLLGMIDDSGGVMELARMMERATVIDRRTLLRHYVERFDAFRYWKRRIGQGFEPLEAARETKTIYEIDNGAADTRDWFLDVGVFCGSIQEDGVKVSPVSGKSIELGSVVADILNRGESAIASIEGYLGPAVWAKLALPVRDHLTRAAERLSENAPPDEIVRSVGLGLDAYLAETGEEEVGGYANQALTLGQTVQKLHDDAVIVSKQKNVLGYATAIRNAAEHPDTDADLPGASWALSTKTAQSYLRVALDTIRSVDARREGRYEL